MSNEELVQVIIKWFRSQDEEYCDARSPDDVTIDGVYDISQLAAEINAKLEQGK